MSGDSSGYQPNPAQPVDISNEEGDAQTGRDAQYTFRIITAIA